jgi:deoxyribodipyrimidine photolyase
MTILKSLVSNMRIKNWNKFQHFKDRRPPWVKLYRDILDDVEWFELDATSSKALVMFWLIASEYDGELPDAKTLAFRLRTTESAIKTICSKLNHWLEQDDIVTTSSGYQVVIPETERETETYTETETDSFTEFWNKYPKKVGKDKALSAWKKKSPKLNDVLFALTWQIESQQWQKGYIPNPATYLNEGRWQDEQPVTDLSPF